MENSDTPQSVPEPCGSGLSTERINSFALVAYIPGDLARFLDELRRDLVPDCIPRAHVTILPPRPISAGFEQAWEHIYDKLKDHPAFEIATAGVQLFPNTGVIYTALASGIRELEQIHDALNREGPLRYSEPYAYHPHITLAQGLHPDEVQPVFKEAQARWAAYSGRRSFDVDTITFVQNTLDNRWVDLAEVRLGPVPVT
ncbi:MAG TPA: 2'-5' RNA ligase family protein [Bryobacteraceae bacterium]|nr:2'-5' RNA ligase family protein [Bryobacteraceae bacterium]